MTKWSICPRNIDYFKVFKCVRQFQDHRAAFKSKTTWEVVRALVVFQLCGVKVLVNNNEVLMKIGKKVLGKTLFAALMKPTFYGQFVAGEVSFKTFSLPFPFCSHSILSFYSRIEKKWNQTLISRLEKKEIRRLIILLSAFFIPLRNVLLMSLSS